MWVLSAVKMQFLALTLQPWWLNSLPAAMTSTTRFTANSWKPGIVNMPLLCAKHHTSSRSLSPSPLDWANDVFFLAGGVVFMNHTTMWWYSPCGPEVVDPSMNDETIKVPVTCLKYLAC